MSTAILSTGREAHEEVLEPSKEIRLQLLWKVDQLQMLPAIAMQALNLAKDPDCSVRQFTSLVEKDMTLASDMLRMANSMIYSRGVPILSLQQAVVRLGFRQCKNLILASSANALMTQLTLKEEWIRQALWKHSFMTGSIASFLNRAMNLGMQGEEFSAGLIHDIGRMLLALMEPTGFLTADKMDFNEGNAENQRQILQREREILGTDHTVLGGWFVEYSGLPKSLAEVVTMHHAIGPELTTRPLVALIAVADHMANHLQRGGIPEEYEPKSNAAVEYLATSKSQQLRLTEIIPSVMQDAIDNSFSM